MIMKTTLGALFFLCTITCYAQDTTLKKVVVLDSTTKFEIEAEFPGGVPGWKKYLNHNLHYPDKAVDNEIQGDVVVLFRIDDQGNTSDYKVVSGPTKGGLREEAIRVIRESGKWVPAIQNGKNVASFRKETISFKMMF